MVEIWNGRKWKVEEREQDNRNGRMALRDTNT